MPKIEHNFKNGHFLKSEEAVAEVLDYITIIGILLLSFSVIGLGGYPILKSAQETRYIENTKLTFIILAESFNKIALGHTLSQSLELKMYGGRLGVTGKSSDSSIKINATWYNSTKHGNEEITLYDQQMRTVENTIGDTAVAYEGTGVWIKYPNGYVLNAHKPLFSNQGNMFVIPVMNIGGVSSAGGSGINRIRAEGNSDVDFYGNVSNLTVTINSSYIDGWKNYYKDELSFSDCDPGKCTVRLNRSNLDVYILRAKMDVVIR
jgi:hypothetical protein